ncbi:GGDEF domain-containing protein [Synechococcus sp. CS-1332]|uniref:GGDEF domain-containing protein n=1 Tax=Synechococcus sp. CS-1332 TaxID=2847972 RepID=UPI00223BA316|nr:GGDEF domain-containing protein [Synechococcus sp. CS-1332]MCT0207233.1 GGDEF domain-containing protein [Synechococcus sp. CS-1332]
MTSEKPLRQPSTKESLLGNLLNKNQKFNGDVAEAGAEFTAVSEVLRQDEVPIEDIRNAHSQNEATEHNVATAAVEITLVNEGLSDEVLQRTTLESDLAETKAERDDLRDDLADARLETEEARQIALKDALTGLPNRLAFDQRLEYGLSQAARHQWGLAVFFIDVDQFKSINDAYGHDWGDQVLQMVATRLTSFLRETDMVSRWGGDEFVCLLPEVKNHVDILHLAEHMVARIAEPCVLDGEVLRVRVSIGIAIFPAHGSTAETLLRHADVAMYEAKAAEKRVVLFQCPDAEGAPQQGVLPPSRSVVRLPPA